MNLGADALQQILARYAATGAAVVVVILSPSQATAPATPPATTAPTSTATSTPTTTPTPAPTTPAPTTGTPDTTPTAAQLQGWGAPVRAAEFDTGTDGWQRYEGAGYGTGRRSPDAVGVQDGVLTLSGDAAGTTGGLTWGSGRRYGRWEARVRAPASDPSYEAVLLLWPDAGNWPAGGEIDFMEAGDPARQTVGGFVHHGPDNQQVRGAVTVDATRWHHWAVDWTPTSIAMFLDGREWYRTTDPAVQPPGPMHLCVQLDWFPKGDGPVRPSTMQVDWVREYAPAGEADGR